MHEKTKLTFQLKLKLWLAILCLASALLLLNKYMTYTWTYSRQATTDQLPSVAATLRILALFERRLQNQSCEHTASSFGRGYGFLKVHKTASTAAQAIFLRYGWRRNLAFLLPYEFNSFGYPNIISMNDTLTSSNVLPPPPGTRFDILCHHVFYGRKAWNQHLPENATKIATIREPFTTFKSVLKYFRPGVVTAIKSKQPLLTFLENPLKFDDRDIRWSILNNRMSLEYGVDPNIIAKRDFTGFEQYLYNVLDKDFSVVIVPDMFEESLVVMKRKLGWTLNDILYLKKILVLPNKKSDIKVEPLELIQTLHKRFAVFDYMLFSYFKTRLLRQINEEYGFKDELIHYKKLLNMTSYFCWHAGMTSYSIHLRLDINLEKAKLSDKVLAFPTSAWNTAFNITLQDCLTMYADEIEFTQAIRKRQYGQATWDWYHHG